MRIILISNYPNDRQESMQRFAQALADGLQNAGHEVQLRSPVPFFGRLKPSPTGFGKWLGYIDKFILFPFTLRKLARRAKREGNTVFHICDHSNAPYLGHLPKSCTSITCHDVLAIQGAFGDASAYCPASRTGAYLQRWILKHLSRAKKLASVSRSTLSNLKELAGGQPANSLWCVIPNTFNADFRPMPVDDAWTLLDGHGLRRNEPFILHVGSALPRKNRKLLLKMIDVLGDKWNGVICLAGQPLDAELLKLAQELGLRERIVSVVKPDHTTLVALYSACTSFIFPSYSEGFGWPVIEAQACGAAVIASNRPPMPEVSGGAAIHADPDDPAAFAEALLALQETEKRDALVQAGFENCQRFDASLIIEQYADLITSSKSHP